MATFQDSYVTLITTPAKGGGETHDVQYHIHRDFEDLLGMMTQPVDWLTTFTPDEGDPGVKSLAGVTLVMSRGASIAKRSFLLQGMPASGVLFVGCNSDLSSVSSTAGSGVTPGGHDSTTEEDAQDSTPETTGANVSVVEEGTRIAQDFIDVLSWLDGKENAASAIVVTLRDRGSDAPAEAFVHVESDDVKEVALLIYRLLENPAAFATSLNKRVTTVQIYPNESKTPSPAYEDTSHLVSFVLEDDAPMMFRSASPDCQSCVGSPGHPATTLQYDKEGRLTKSVLIRLKAISVARWCP